jgi:hypothetical protein
MHRYAVLLLCFVLVAVAGGLLAAPAPFPRSGRGSPWYDGWDKPVDPVGDCRFQRTRDKLTLIVPPAQHGPHPRHCRLLRDVEGDFTMRVRLGGAVRQCEPSGYNWAGFFVTGRQCSRPTDRWCFLVGVAGPRLQDAYHASDGLGQLLPIPPHPWVQSGPPGAQVFSEEGLPAGGEVYLQLQRRGDRILAAWSRDSEGPMQDVASLARAMPRWLKVGVYAQAGLERTHAVFDEFKLTRLGGMAR